MKVSLSTNTSASLANRNLSKADIAVRHSINRLSTGRRINKSTDDGGGLSVSYALTNKLSKNREISTSLSNSLSFLQVQEGALRSVGSILSRMTELKTMSLDVMKNGNDLEAYNKGFKELQLELGHISKYKFNGVSIFSDQIPKILFGESQGLEVMKQVTDDENFSQTANITRWGIYRNFSVNLEGIDDFPDKEKVSPAKDFLAFTITDESSDTKNGRWRGYSNDLDKYEKDLESWTQWVSDNNLDIKIAAVVAQQSGKSEGGPLLPNSLNEENDLPPFVNAYRGMLRESGGFDAYDEDKAVDFLKDAFLDMTNGGSELPRAVGFFVDNSGSLWFNQVNQAVFKFKEWIESNYGKSVGGSIATSSVTDPEFLTDPEGESAIAGPGKTGWVNGVWMAGYEDWIEQSRAAIEDLIASDKDILDAVNEGTLDDDKTGIKSLFDSTYDLDEFDMSEFQGFLEKLSTAMGTNGAETEAIKQRLKGLQNTYHSSELAHAKVDSVDIAKESTKFAKRSVLLHATASILLQANQINDVALSLLS